MVAQSQVRAAVAGLDAWLDTMRGPHGYGGPVAHWWRDSLLYCGAGLDWRYEGIVCGYLTLYQTTAQDQWLEKAYRAGMDLVTGQLPSGHFRNSRFELNPGVGGTPHEAAADIALLRLAGLRQQQRDAQPFLDAAQRNVDLFYINICWNAGERWFRDDPSRPSFVPNKAATLIEALLLLAELTGETRYLDYVGLTADAIVALQAPEADSHLGGGIAQNIDGGRVVHKYFPFYVARCIPGLVAAGKALGRPRYHEAAQAALAFVARWQDETGGLPQVVYPGGRVNRYPVWRAGVGDVLRAADSLLPYGGEFPYQPATDWMMAGVLPSGGVATGVGFASRSSQTPPHTPDLRDLLPACGWADKAFRYLASLVEGDEPLPAADITDWEAPCVFQGMELWLREDREGFVATWHDQTVYQWCKGSPWATLALPQLGGA